MADKTAPHTHTWANVVRGNVVARAEKKPLTPSLLQRRVSSDCVKTTLGWHTNNLAKNAQGSTAGNLPHKAMPGLSIVS